MKGTSVEPIKKKSTAIFFGADSLASLIYDGKVKAHCSDDFYYNGISIETDSVRNFRLHFTDDELWIFKYQSRDRYQKLNLDTLPCQVFHLEKKNE